LSAQLPRFADERQLDDDLRFAQRHDEEKPQCGHGVVDGRRAGAARDKMQLTGDKKSLKPSMARMSVHIGLLPISQASQRISMRGWLRAREIGKGWSVTVHAFKLSYARIPRIWYRLDQTVPASFFGDAEIPLEGNIEAGALK